MSKNPSDTWFYNDWENDPELKTCSLAAQGLWMRLLCIAARSPERGVVQIGSLDFSHPKGLQQIAAAVGRSQEEITPLIDELVSSGAASLDRKRRVTNRRMVRAAKTSEVRAQSGRNGASVTNRNRWQKVDLGQQSGGKDVDKTSPSSRLPFSESSSHKDSPDSTAPASAGPKGPPRAPLPDTAKWAERLAGYRPWEGKSTWPPFWGPRPDSLQKPSMIPPGMHRTWLDDYEAAKRRGEAA